MYSLCIRCSVVLKVSWVSREFNTEVDELPKHIDVTDWEISSAFFNYLNSIWLPFTIDCSASAEKKIWPILFKILLSLYNAFLESWENKNKFAPLLIPLVDLIPEVLKHLQHKIY